MIARTRTKGRQTPDHDFRGEFQHADYRTLCRRGVKGMGALTGDCPRRNTHANWYDPCRACCPDLPKFV